MKTLLRSLLPALLYLLLIGLQSAMGAVGCPSAPGSQHYVPSTQVNACHFFVDINTTDVCCDNASCHLNSSPLRHFGSPEYANQIKDLLPLILESRQQVPQPKTAPALQERSIGPLITRQESLISIAPRHALLFLRTTVLLH